MNPTALPRPDGRAIFLGAMAVACKPRKRLTVSQWADAHRRLSNKASSEPGQWRTSRVPYLREPMDCLSVHSPVQSASIMKSAQTGFTEVALNWIGYVMDHAQAPMLAVVPTLDVRKRWVRQRVDPMLADTPTLAALFDSRRKRDGANAEEMKDFPNGMLVIGGANSPASLASMPIKYVVNDEVDRFPWEVGGEGDPLGLIRMRQANFPRRKELNISSPTVEGASRIEELFNAGDQRHYHVPCPHTECGELLVLKWKQLQWHIDKATGQVAHAWYVCEHCGAAIDEHHKTEMLKEVGHGGRARWIPKHPGRAARSYHINGLYAPLGLGLRWVELADNWLKAQGDKTKLKVFINTKLGEVWQDQDKKVDHRSLSERAEPYGLREIPLGCLLLTCGVDVQDDRLELQVLGHGRGKVTWTIDKLVLPGDPARDEVWDHLTDYLIKPFTNQFGRELMIEATGIDTGGHHTQDVYNYVRSVTQNVYNYVRSVKELQAKRRPRRVMAMKGANTPGKPILTGRPLPQDVNHRNKYIKHGVLLWMIGTDTAKDLLNSRLKGDANHDAGSRLVRFSNALPEDFYLQLTAEVFDPERNKWVKLRNRRNEDLDTWIYGTAAAYHPEVRVHAMQPRDWARLELMLEPKDITPAPTGTAAPEAITPAPKAKPRKPSGDGDGGGFGSSDWNL